MPHLIRAGLVAAAFVSALPVQAETFKEFFPEIHSLIDDETRAIVDTIEIQTGKVVIGGGMVEVDLPPDYYMIDQADARTVLETLWGNPPDDQIFGMIFPRKGSPLDDTWGVTIHFEEIGYVSDEDAGSYDYDELLETMKADTLGGNEWRVQNGYERIELIGWAAEPHYDQATKELYWAKRLHFDGIEGDTLNYNIRELGRKGVLVVNFIASMEQLAEVETTVPAVLKMITFKEGHRYADFTPGVDTVAAVGIGGLIAGKVLAKTGFLIVLLALLKKGGFLLIIPVMWLINRFRGKS